MAVAQKKNPVTYSTGTTYYPNQPAPAKHAPPKVGTGITYNGITYGANGTQVPSGTVSPTSTGTSMDQQNAMVIIDGILAEYGLQSLSSVVLGYVQQGYNSDAINVLIQQTPEWKQRFAGNIARQQNGLAPLDPATYLATEASYAQVIAQAGLPAGFYSGGQDFASWIGQNISPAEIQQRATDAGDLVNSQDPGILAALSEQGIDSGQLAAYFLDPSKALPIIQNTYNAVKIGAAASDNGLTLNGQRAQQFASMGVTQAQAQSDYQQISQALPAAKTLSDIYGQAYGQTQLENELLGQSGEAQNERMSLARKEESNFSGSGAAGATLQDPGYGLAQSTTGKF